MAATQELEEEHNLVLAAVTVESGEETEELEKVLEEVWTDNIQTQTLSQDTELQMELTVTASQDKEFRTDSQLVWKMLPNLESPNLRFLVFRLIITSELELEVVRVIFKTLAQSTHRTLCNKSRTQCNRVV